MTRRVRRPAPNPERPWVHAGHHERRCGGADSPALQGLPVPLPPADLPDHPPPGVPVPVEIGGH
jgi:hypothetical protein